MSLTTKQTNLFDFTSTLLALRSATIFVLGALHILGPSLVNGAPANDNFANRFVLVGSSVVTNGTTVDATSEGVVEPKHSSAAFPNGNSVWYTWTAPFKGSAVIQVSTFTNDYSTPIIAVYTNSTLTTLGRVADDSSTFNLARVVFTAIANQTYQIAVDGAAFNSIGFGDFTLSITLSSPPVNDSFAQSTLITGNYYTNAGSFKGASREQNEPSHGAPGLHETLWWTWRAPTNLSVSTSSVSLVADSVSLNPVIAVYTGNSLNSLSSVSLNVETNGMTTFASFTANAGTTYQIALAGEQHDPVGNVVSQRFGDYRFRLNNRALILSIRNLLLTSDGGGGYFADADAEIRNIGAAATKPIQVSVYSIPGLGVRGPDDGSPAGIPSAPEIFTPGQTIVTPGNVVSVHLTGFIPAESSSGDTFGLGYALYAELQEQQSSTTWSTVDQALIAFGDWPELGTTPGPGGGTIRQDPNYNGASDANSLSFVRIVGPARIPEGITTNYSLEAMYTLYPSTPLTNVSWVSSLFTISNGVFVTSDIAQDQPVTISAQYSYEGFAYVAVTNVIVVDTNIPPNILHVLVLGNGTVTPNLDGHSLELGKSYTITAKPALGYIFSSWSGGVSANSSTLTFVMTPNLVLQANFVLNPFTPIKGNFAGLFYHSKVEQTNSGAFSALITDKGTFTSKLQLGGKTYALAGQFSANGSFSNTLKRPNLPSLSIEMQIDLNSHDQITGTISDGNWISTLTAYRGVFSKTSPSPFTGYKFTLILPGSSNSSIEPGGYGFGSGTVDSSGNIKFVGTLGDGTKFTQQTTLFKDEKWPFFVAPYGGKGLVLGWLNFDRTQYPLILLSGEVTWIKLPQAAKYYPAGFDLTLEAEGSFFSTVGSPGLQILQWTDGFIILQGGNLNDRIMNPITINSGNKVSVESGSLGFITSSGQFKGSIVNPSTSKKISFSGATLFDRGYGLFLGTSETGQVFLQQAF
jgi:hypothetical protein